MKNKIMKQIFLLTIVVFLALQLKAQLVYDKWGNMIPFSSAEEYKTDIEAYEVPGYVIPFMNNDSLCRKYNDGKTIKELEDRFIGGINLHIKPISLKENGVRIKLQHGTLWRYAIEGVSAKGICVDLGIPRLPKGTYISLIAVDTTVSIVQPPKVYYQGNLLERHKTKGLTGCVYGNKLIIEYYEPGSLKNKEDIEIKWITYEFVGFGNPGKSSYNEPGLKSGYWGSSQYSDCQKDVECQTYGDYRNEAKSVVYLELVCNIDEDDNGTPETTTHIKGTGFFVNKVGGYASNDLPILVTAGHAYCIKISGSAVDLDGYISRIEARTNYQNAECGTDDLNNRGRLLPGSFNRIALGSSWDDDGLPSL